MAASRFESKNRIGLNTEFQGLMTLEVNQE